MRLRCSLQGHSFYLGKLFHPPFFICVVHVSSTVDVAAAGPAHRGFLCVAHVLSGRHQPWFCAFLSWGFSSFSFFFSTFKKGFVLLKDSGTPAKVLSHHFFLDFLWIFPPSPIDACDFFVQRTIPGSAC